MKWTLGQLAKIQKPMKIEYELDFTSFLDKMDGVKAISPVFVKGECYEIGFDEYVFSLDIKCELTMICAISLENVSYPLNIHTDEIFKTSNPDGDDINLVSNNMIDLDPVVLANVIMNIPMKVVKEGEEFEEEEIEERINPAFADLDKYL